MSKLESRILELFNHNRIVFFYDNEGQFENEIKNLNLENIKLHELTFSNLFKTKYILEIEDTKNNYLIYAPFSKPDDEKNNLADIIYYSKEFHADRISMILEELSLSNEFRPFFEKYKTFFNAQLRIDAFENLFNNTDKSKKSLILSILSTLCNIGNTNFDEILKEVLTEDLKENELIESFKKFKILDEFWNLVKEHYYYEDNKPTVEKLLTKLLITYSATQIDVSPPKAWEKNILPNPTNVKVFISNLMNNSSNKNREHTYRDIYDNLSSIISKKIDLNSQIRQKPVETFYKCDGFRLFDEKIIEHLSDILHSTQEYNLQISELSEIRRTTHFYKEYENEYKAIKWANFLIKNSNSFEKESKPIIPEEIIKRYIDDWFFIDKSYRKFNYYFDEIENSDNFHNLRQLVENIYTNTFLTELSILWTENFNDYNTLNYPKQYDFYRKYVRLHGRKHKTVVFISDALRYGVCDELKDELNKNPKISIDMETMISVLPSNTSFGMAALLPHKTLEFKNNKLLVDGLPSQSSDNRKRILENYEKDFNNKPSTVVKFDDISSLRVKDIKNELKNYNLIYIYHNKIDSIGDNPATEKEVFKASKEAIFEIRDFIKTLTSSGLENFIITADHGFIYKKDKIEESAKVDVSNPNILSRNKRYLLSNEKLDIESTKIYELAFLENDLYVTVPKGADIFKSPGSGLNYVHGGASLEEMIVPVLIVKSSMKGNLENLKNSVKINLISPINRRITNLSSYLTFAQSENISDTVGPVEAKIYFINENGDKISNELIIHANKKVDSPQMREFKEKITLRDMTYNKNENYYLIIENMENDAEINRYEFIVDIAFGGDGFEF